MTTHDARTEPPKGRRLVSLALLALGIVYGDIGTSPLYAIRECFHGSHPVALDHANVLGEGLFRVVGRYGYMEHVDLPALLERITDEKLKRINPTDTTYIVGVHRLIVTGSPIGMAKWRERIFASMMRNATGVSNFLAARGKSPDPAA